MSSNSKVKFVRRQNRREEKVKETLDVADDTDVADAMPRERQRVIAKRRSNRLRFKTTGSVRHQEETQDVNDEEETATPELARPEPVRREPHYRPNSADKVREFGPEINGFRFVAVNSDNVIEEKEEEEPHSPPVLEQRHQSYNYKTYSVIWTQLEEAGTLPQFIPLPISSNSMDDLNEANLRAFIPNKASARQERIRWHPDKMIVRLEKLGITEHTAPGYREIVTRVFQLVNKVFNEF